MRAHTTATTANHLQHTQIILDQNQTESRKEVGFFGGSSASLIELYVACTSTKCQGQAVHTSALTEQQVITQMETSVSVYTGIWNTVSRCNWLVALRHAHTKTH